MAQQEEEAHVCGTERQRKTNEGKEDTEKKHSNSLPPHCGATTMIGRTSQAGALHNAGCRKVFLCGVIVMATWGRFDSGSV